MNNEEKTILMVDDEAIICMEQTEILKNEGYNVQTAISGEAAIELFEKGNKIDLILMDIDLGNGMDGTQAAEIILRDHDIPLIFLSNHTEMEIVRKTDKITSYGYIVKNSGEYVLDTAIKMAFRLYDACHENTHKSKLLEDSELRYRRLFESAQDGIFILNANTGKIIDVNPYLADLIDYTYDELIGKFLWDVSPFHDIAENKVKFLELQKKGYVHYENLPLLNKNGLIKNVEFVSNVYFENERPIIQCNIRDIENRKKIEDAKESVLMKKTTLLRELQHRIKNSLAIITGLIGLESERSTDAVMKDALFNIRNRILSISHLYDLLDNSQNSDEIQLDKYVEKTMNLLFQSYSQNNSEINLEMHLSKIRIDMDITLSVGLILNELISNSLKYAFPDNRPGFIRITLQDNKENIFLEVQDNGIGTPSDFTVNDSKGMGMSLVRLLTEQINGSFEKIPTIKGTRFRIQFPLIKTSI